jgi:hypothetical protein
MTADDRSYLKRYFNDASSDTHTKKIILLCLHEVKDRSSIDWIIDNAAAETDGEMREKILLVLLAIDRKQTLATLAEKSAADQRYKGLEAMAGSMSKGR